MAGAFTFDTVFAGIPGIDQLQTRHGRYGMAFPSPPIAGGWPVAATFIYSLIIPLNSQLVEWRCATAPDILADAANYGRVRLIWTNTETQVVIGQLTSQVAQFPEIDATAVPPSGVSPASGITLPAGAIIRVEIFRAVGAPTAITQLIVSMVMEPA